LLWAIRGRQCGAEAGTDLEKHPAALDGVKFGRNGDLTEVAASWIMP